MISNEKFDEQIYRLQSTLKARLNLLNLFYPLVNEKYKPLTTENIDIDINSEYEIINFIIKNNKIIEDVVIPLTINWFSKNGSHWQKKRLGIKS